MYTRVCLCLLITTYVCTPGCACVCARACVCLCAPGCAGVQVCVRVRGCVCVRVYMCARKHVCMYYTCIYACMHVITHPQHTRGPALACMCQHSRTSTNLVHMATHTHTHTHTHRGDRNALQAGDEELAQSEKARIEERQRRER